MNKTMIPVAAMLSALLVGPVAASPHGGGPGKAGGQGAEQRLERMTEQLDLSAEQQQAMAAIFDAQASQRAKMRAQMREQIDAVLTEEQRAKRAELRAERIDQRVARMAERLDLSAEQSTQLKALFTENQNAGRSSRAGSGSMREQLASILTVDQLAELGKGRDKGRQGKGDNSDCNR
ncbi:Spy/CpxP family protein refolding chaperone [Thiorhodovibrio frisius]|uniref:P pilus assembly/Cpx signaling pathway, periplasmic inhibitor/zinc-resistance associated protein n=1 Tax=Thiorhodovibrio frisius TaxID=631362 RepID=H8Z8C4_9GAMM|nr:Spy/CpxP family protein refolding chaperone [Thiorhodovibrio frisius]EIC21073.1 hypothetical protein Thi970DRAFT_04758 [Thiorhodovibrio frisius]WPL22134.1 periplasmic repressor CpxP [Thiorhodovibrio frisius]